MTMRDCLEKSKRNGPTTWSARLTTTSRRHCSNLENGLKTAVISTAYKEDVHTIMEKAGPQERMFDLILGADSLEAMKPDPEAFRYALKKLGVKPREALFVGDDVEADYKAAEKAGIKAVLIQ